MKIAIDARSLEGDKTGVGRYLENLLKVWSKKNDVEFVLYFQKSVPDRDFLKSYENKVIGSFFGFYSNFIFQHILLPLHLKKDKIDFFFSPFYLRPLFCPVASAIVLHDISYEAHPEWFDGKSQIILRTLSKVSARKADMIFTVSNFSKSEIIRLYNEKEGKIVVTHLAPDLDFAKNTNNISLEKVKEKYGDDFIFCVGTIFNRRHVPEILEAFSDFSRYNKCKLVLVGKNKTHPYIDIDGKISRINNTGEEKVFHLDFIEEDELIALYSASKAIIYLSDYEGFGLPVVEAQFFGKPVITSFNTSLIEVGGDSVEFVKKNTSEEILEAFKKVLDDEDRFNALSKGAVKNLGRFSWDRSAGVILDNILKKN